MIDVDYFKVYNDNYGHSAGDECLAAVSGALKRSLHRPTDLVARYGGEEFTVVLPDTDEHDVAVIAERVRHNIEALGIEHKASANKVVTVSVGAASSNPFADQTFLQLIEVADRALYQAKESGRNSVVYDRLQPPEYLRS